MFELSGLQLWTIAIGAAANVSCALVGCYLVLRRMSLLGDAISHAVLPGLVVAFLLSGTLAPGPMFLGAVAVGLLTALLTQTLHRYGGVPEDASMGVVFTGLFALGVILLSGISGVHLDQECVFSGKLEVTALLKADFLGWSVPRAFVSLTAALSINLTIVLVCWKELKIASFDPELATTLGINASVVHYGLMAMVALTTVAAFEAVGSILVVAMLIVPAAAAHLLTDRLWIMQLIAAAIGVASALVGYLLALAWNTSAAGMMAVVAGAIFLTAVLAAPRYGVVAKTARQLRLSLRIVREDALALLYRLEELGVQRPMPQRECALAVGGGLAARLGVASLCWRGAARRTPEGLALTERGRRRARALVRSHRLWEQYLVERLGMPLDHVHDPAMRMEHYIGDRMQQAIADQLQESQRDPHGREIPRPGDDAPTPYDRP